MNYSGLQVSTWSSCTMAPVTMWTGNGFTTRQILTMPKSCGRAIRAIKIRNYCAISQVEKYGSSMETTLHPPCLLILPTRQSIDRILAHREANPRPRAFACAVFVDGLRRRHVHPRSPRSQRTAQRHGLPSLLHTRKHRPTKTRRPTLRRANAGFTPAKTCARSRRQLICPTLRPPNLAALRPPCPDVLSSGANNLALAECRNLRNVLLSGVEPLRESARRAMDRAHRSPRLPRILSPDCMGPDVRSCSPLLHSRVCRAQQESALPRRSRDRISNLQTATWRGGHSHFLVRPRMEGDHRCNSGSSSTTQHWLALLRHAGYEGISARTASCPRGSPHARASPLSNALAPRLLVSADSVDATSFSLVCNNGGCCTCGGSALLAKQGIPRITLFRRYARHCTGCASSHRI